MVDRGFHRLIGVADHFVNARVDPVQSGIDDAVGYILQLPHDLPADAAHEDHAVRGRGADLLADLVDTHSGGGEGVADSISQTKRLLPYTGEDLGKEVVAEVVRSGGQQTRQVARQRRGLPPCLRKISQLAGCAHDPLGGGLAGGLLPVVVQDPGYGRDGNATCLCNFIKFDRHTFSAPFQIDLPRDAAFLLFQHLLSNFIFIILQKFFF